MAVKLSVHRNTQERRKAHQLRKDLIEDVRVLASREGVVGYAVVVWTVDWEADAGWNCGNLPGSVMPEFVKETLRRKIGMNDAQTVIFGSDDGR